MSEQIRELESQIERLESRLTIARSDLARLRERGRKGRGAWPLVLALVAASTVLIVAAEPPTPVKTTTVVPAPFQVVGHDAAKIFEVSEGGILSERVGSSDKFISTEQPRGFALFDSAEKPLLLGAAKEGDSYLGASAAGRIAEVRMGVENGDSGTGNPAFGARYMGKERLSMAVVDGKPYLEMTDEHGWVTARAGVNQYEGGFLQLVDGEGTTRVKFSTSSNGAGTVVTYPNGGAGGAIVGLKGTMLCGQGGCKQ